MNHSMENFDYVIVGAGSAGCILSYRLAEAGYSVCVLEAGPTDWNPFIRMPAGFMKTSTDRSITWQLNTTGNPNTNGRKIPFIQGKVLGGSSAINGMVYNRGQASDFDNWAALGNEDWDYASVLPYFRRTERFVGEGDDVFRGREGRVPITTLARRDAVCDSFIQGAIETGIPATNDYNGSSQTGVCYAQANIYKGRRWSTNHAYLRTAKSRYGVKVTTHATAQRVVIENGMAIGVDYTLGDNPKIHSVRSRFETIVSAGTINSPKLLQLSGIGPSALLQSIGIPVVAHLPGVGQNLSDHYSARLVARVHDGVDTINQHSRGLPLMRELANWGLGRPSILSMSVMSVYGFYKADPQATENEYLITFTPASLKGGATRVLDEVPGISSGGYRLRPESRGEVRIQSRSAEESPHVDPNYLDVESDRAILIAALKRSRAILRSNAMKSVVKAIGFPAQDCQTDDEWLDFIKQYGMTTYHFVGTCKMGSDSDPMSVVDARLRVRGLRGLRVVDASVMPTTPSGNTNAATMMIAERASDLILADRKQSHR